MLLISSSLLNQFSRVQHGFFSRIGGVSEGEFFSLNCNTKSTDDHLKIKTNIYLVAKNFEHFDNIKMLRQVHSNSVIKIEKQSQICSDISDIEADVIVTNLPQVLIAVQTADCIPALFCDPNNGIIAAAHVGWRGAFSGAIANTVKEMVNLGAKNITAAIGPCIRMGNYEVDHNFYQNAISIDVNAKKFFIVGKREQHYYFDLPGYCRLLLELQDVKVDDLGIDTYNNPQLFFSYRRTCHKTESGLPIKCGNQISAIMLK